MSSAAAAAMLARAARGMFLLQGGRRCAAAASPAARQLLGPSSPSPASPAASFSAAASASSSPPASSSAADAEPLREHLGGLEHVDVDVDRAAGIATLRLNRPRALNALSSAVCEELVDVALRLDADRGVRALVVTGQPPPPPPCSPEPSSPSAAAPAAAAASGGSKPRRPVFAAGADIREMAGMGARAAREGRLYQGWRRLAAVRMPLVAAVNGVALGGGFELAMMCDIIIASEDAEFGLPEVTLGVIPLMGGTQRLARLAGRAVAMDVALAGRRLTAAEALRWGVVSRVVAASSSSSPSSSAGAQAAAVDAESAVVAEAQAVAARLAALPARAVEAAKRAVAFAADGGGGGGGGEGGAGAGGGGGLMAGLDLEERLFHECFATRDREEGMSAFLERRKPEWRHC